MTRLALGQIGFGRTAVISRIGVRQAVVRNGPAGVTTGGDVIAIGECGRKTAGCRWIRGCTPLGNIVAYNTGAPRAAGIGMGRVVTANVIICPIGWMSAGIGVTSQ